jgi:hypothetical protein
MTLIIADGTITIGRHGRLRNRKDEVSMNDGEAGKAFENVRDQIGTCGIWCGSCIVGNGSLRELTRKYRGLITIYSLDEWGPKDVNYGELLRALESIESMPSCSGCLKGGGRDHCEMRSCAESKRITGCSACRETAACKHLEVLQHMRSGAIKAGLFVTTEDLNKQHLIENWTSKLKASWPASALFASD